MRRYGSIDWQREVHVPNCKSCFYKAAAHLVIGLSIAGVALGAAALKADR